MIMITNTISKLLKNLHERDQKSRRQIIEKQGTTKMAEARDKSVFYVFGGECQERACIVSFFIKNDALKSRDDFFYAAAILINVGNFKNFVTAYRLIKKYRAMGGRKPWGFYDKYFEIQDWGKTRDEVLKEVEKRIGIHPGKLDRMPKNLP